MSSGVLFAAALVAAFTNDHAILTFDSAGRIASLVDRATDRELTDRPFPASSVWRTDGREVFADALSVRKGRLVFTYPGARDPAELTVRTEPWGFVFAVEASPAADQLGWTPLMVHPAASLAQYGAMLNGASDDRSLVALRAYDLEMEMRIRTAAGQPLKRSYDLDLMLRDCAALETFVPHGAKATGLRFSLVAVPRSSAIDALKSMTLDSGGLRSACGGAWSAEAVDNRRSYLFAPLRSDTVDDWIALAERGGFSTLHFTLWWKWLGHYYPSTVRFPKSVADLKKAVGKVHQAGLSASTHSLCSGIHPVDPWITPECRDDLLELASYTLARPLADGDSELIVNERPDRRHALVTAYFSNGNILRVGTELMTYDGIRREKPYAFTGLRRGAYKTRGIGLVPAGAKVTYVYQHFGTLFPDPRKPFCDEMAANFAKLFGECGFDMCYQDGAEAFSRYEVDLNRLKFTRALGVDKRPIRIEASLMNAHSWWYHSSGGAWDYCRWAPKRFHDRHLRQVVGSVRQGDFLAAQVGWWAPILPTDEVEGHYLDDMEYFAAKNAANDLPMSVTDVDGNGLVPFAQEAMMTVLGWYERVRLAKGFSPAALSVMGRDGVESRLRQNVRGEWKIEPVVSFTKRIRSAEERHWNIRAPASRKLSLRVKASYGTEAYETASAKRLFGVEDVSRLKIETAAREIVQTVTAANDAERGRTIVFSAENGGIPTEKAWSQASWSEGHPFRDLRVASKAGLGGFGFWVKGDGSGAVLDLQVRSPGMYDCGWSDHLLKIDFTGWRYFTFLLRDRDAGAFGEYAWAHPVFVYPQFRQLVNLKWVERVGIMLTRIPMNGKTTVEISEIRVLPSVPLTLTGGSVSIGDRVYAIPFKLASGEWAEMDDGFWTHYAKTGDPIERKGAFDEPIAGGLLSCAFSADQKEARADIVLFARGGSRVALADGATSAKSLAYEAQLPQWYEPAKGFGATTPVAVRPGERARLELEIIGTVKNPTLKFSKGEFRFPVETTANERFICRDGLSWQVKDAHGIVIREGRLAAAMPLLEKGFVTFSADAASAARVNFIKRYVAKEKKR